MTIKKTLIYSMCVIPAKWFKQAIHEVNARKVGIHRNQDARHQLFSHESSALADIFCGDHLYGHAGVTNKSVFP